MEALIEILKSGDENAQSEVSQTLASIGVPAVEPLIGVLSDGNASARRMAADLLGQIKDSRAVEALIAALNDSEETVRISAAYALGELADERAISALIAALKDPSDEVGKEAGDALVNIREAAEIPDCCSEGW